MRVENVPAAKRCELCGAEITADGTDRPARTDAEVIRRLAFLADQSPSLAILLIYHVAGRTEREIAKLCGIPKATVHYRLKSIGQKVNEFPCK